VPTTQTLLPNGTRSGAGDFTVTGAALIHVALNDTADGTYVLRTSTTATKSFVVNLASYTLAANERIQSVRIAVRMARGGAQSKVYVRQGYVTDSAAGTIRYGAADQYTGSSSIGWVTGADRTTAPDGQPWDQTRLNDLVVKVTDYSPTSAGRTTVYEVTAEVIVNVQPTITVDAPTGTITDTSRPAIAWTYSDADGDGQTAYEVRVFTAAQYGASGFDPASSSAVWESGEVTSTDPGTTPGTDLENTVVHRAYVRAGHALSGTTFYSAWGYAQFTMGYESPPAPDLSAAYQSLTNRVNVTAVGHTNMLTDNDASLASTVGTWTAVTGCNVARSTAVGAAGSSSLSMTATGAGTMSARTGAYPIPTDGQQVSARAEFRPDASLRTVTVGLRWLDSTGATISTTTGTGATEVTATWTAATVTGTPPANATQAQVIVTVQSAASAEVHYVDKIALHNGATSYWSPGGLYDSQIILVERSTDGGDTWEAIDTADAGNPEQAAFVTDYAAERDATNAYRARVIGYSGESAVASPFTTGAAAWVPNDGKWWIKADGDEDLTIGGALVLGPVTVTREQNGGVFRPLGRSTPIVVTGDQYGLDGEYEVIVSGDTDWATAEPLLMSWTGDVIVQDPFGTTKRVQIVSREFTLEGAAGAPRRRVIVGYVEV
jgi:hypothetical protein